MFSRYTILNGDIRKNEQAIKEGNVNDLNLEHLIKNTLIASAIFALSACGAMSSSSAQPELEEIAIEQDASILYQHEWQLASLAGEKAGKGADGRLVSIRFDQESNKISGYAGCNNYFSLFSVEGDALSIGAIGMTRRYCSKQADLETQFTQTLSNAKFYQISEGKLLLLNAEKQVTATLIKG